MNPKRNLKFECALFLLIPTSNTQSVCPTTREKETDRDTFFFKKKRFLPPKIKKIKKYPV
jgi:hypothetical protein